ncbi:MAG: DUF1592 domain-containing protein [Myxococcales bacterium]|nr:DUF1592 domain-containing protein [Myxococcales bacterium]
MSALLRRTGLVLLLCGCDGAIVGGVDSPLLPGVVQPQGPVARGPETPTPPVTMERGPTPSPFVCQPSAQARELPLRRLSRVEYTNTLDAFVRAASPQAATAALTAAQTGLGQLPADARVPAPTDTHGGFARLDQTVQQPMVDASWAVALTIGQQLTRPAARLGQLMGPCATDADTTNDASCLRTLVTRLAPLAHRSRVTQAEVDVYVAIAGTTPVAPDAVADVLVVMMTAPAFLYHLESGTTALAANVFALDAFELASRLSYHFWQSPPDDELRARAQDGSLLTDAVYRRQVDRLVADARAANVRRAFFSEWFRLDELGSLTSRLGTPQYDAFVGANRPSGQLREAMFDEVLTAAEAAVSEGLSLERMLGDARHFSTNPELSSLYGVPAWDGRSPAVAPPHRSGLFTRAAFLANESATTRPVMKGLRLRSAFLCDTMPPPPGNLMVTTPELSPTATTRDVVANITEQPGSTCLGCHVMLNPLGYASENFDALGRHRQVQPLFDEQGRQTAAPPVRTDAMSLVDLDDDRAFADIAAVTRRMAESRRVDSCFARHAFRFAFRRPESLELDACALAAIDEASRGGSLSSALAAVAHLPSFKTRRINP